MRSRGGRINLAHVGPESANYVSGSGALRRRRLTGGNKGIREYIGATWLYTDDGEENGSCYITTGYILGL